MVVLAHDGGGSALTSPTVTEPNSTSFDLDLWYWDSVAPFPSINPQILGGLGTTNFNMAFAGNDLFVVSTFARNDVVGNETLLGPQRTDELAKTRLYRIRDSDADGFPDSAGITFINLNDSLTDPATQSVVQATDLDIYVDPVTSITYVCIVGFDSDR